MRHAPLLITHPTRFVALPRPLSRAILAVVALLLLASLLTSAIPSEPPQTDLLLYTGIVEQMRHGDPYYDAAADALRASDAPLRTFRLPPLALIQATLPGPLLVILQWTLAASVLAAWWLRLAPAVRTPAIKIAILPMLAIGTAAGWQYGFAPYHELWAGLFIALSLALRTRDRWIESVALGLAAALLGETALLYLLVMIACALIEGRRVEASGWAAAIAIFAVALTAHASAVADLVQPFDAASSAWAVLPGPGFVGAALAMSSGLLLFPVTITALSACLSLLGWIAWRDEAGLRVAATFVAYALFLSIAARPQDVYWALLIAPIGFTGLVFAPDAIRDLLAGALDRRRITVRRVVR